MIYTNGGIYVKDGHKELVQKYKNGKQVDKKSLHYFILK